MFYFIIPTINGGICGEPYIITDIDSLKSITDEVTIYKIEICSINYSIKEVDFNG